MRINVTFKQIEAFLAVAETLSFSQAANRTFLSQPALSANIQRLEAIVGAKLFERDTRKVALTAVGQEFRKLAMASVDGFNHGLARINDFATGKRGRLIIAAVPSLCAGFVPGLIAGYMNAYQDVDVQLHDVLSEVCIEMVRAGTADVALAPAKEDANDLLQLELYRDYLGVLFAADHPLAARRTVKWDHIKPYRQIVMSAGGSVRNLVEAEYIEHGVPLKPLFEVGQVSTLLGLVAAGLGVGELPMSLIRTVNLQGLDYRRISNAKTYRTICAITSRTNLATPTVERFIQMSVEKANLAGERF
jgi:LysR family carnitine catabolism transcriptional activator